MSNHAAAADKRDQTKGYGSLCVGLDVSLAQRSDWRVIRCDSKCVCVS